MRLIALFMASMSLSMMLSAARAQDLNWRLKAGPALVTFDEEALIEVTSGVFPGAGLETDAAWNGSFEIGRYITPEIVIAASISTPTTIDIKGTGAIETLATVAEIDYAPTTVTLLYHFENPTIFTPYFGGGVSYFNVTGTTDGGFTEIRVGDDFGAVIQLGTLIDITDRIDAFVDIKKSFLEAEIRGVLNLSPVKTDLRLNPLSVQSGVAVSF